jgi:O-acetyl-ADP-ribose deacetylase (regulator of RNase III)
MTRVEVLSGDITRVKADSLITAINSGGMWFGGIDGAIQRCAGDIFHAKAAAEKLTDGKTVFASSDHFHGGSFKSVLFVVDDLKQPLREIVTAALREAERRQLSSITLPTIRTGVMVGVYEPTAQAALDEMAIAVRQFVATSPQMERITFVIYNDSPSMQYLERALQLS